MGLNGEYVGQQIHSSPQILFFWFRNHIGNCVCWDLTDLRCLSTPSSCCPKLLNKTGNIYLCVNACAYIYTSGIK